MLLYQGSPLPYKATCLAGGAEVIIIYIRLASRDVESIYMSCIVELARALHSGEPQNLTLLKTRTVHAHQAQLSLSAEAPGENWRRELGDGERSLEAVKTADWVCDLCNSRRVRAGECAQLLKVDEHIHHSNEQYRTNLSNPSMPHDVSGGPVRCHRIYWPVHGSPCASGGRHFVAEDVVRWLVVAEEAERLVEGRHVSRFAVERNASDRAVAL